MHFSIADRKKVIILTAEYYQLLNEYWTQNQLLSINKMNSLKGRAGHKRDGRVIKQWHTEGL